MKINEKSLGRTSIVMEGEYVPNKEYKKLSFVTVKEENKCYISRRDIPVDTDIHDEYYWQLIINLGNNNSIWAIINDNIYVNDANNVIDEEASRCFISGFNCNVKGFAATAEGDECEAIDQSHAEGSNTKALGCYSHTEGYNTSTSNNAEHAQGQYNKSTKHSATFGDSHNTLHSIGIGTSDNDRKNAVEVMQNGNVYIIGIGGYDGTNIDTAICVQDVIKALVNK